MESPIPPKNDQPGGLGKPSDGSGTAVNDNQGQQKVEAEKSLLHHSTNSSQQVADRKLQPQVQSKSIGVLSGNKERSAEQVTGSQEPFLPQAKVRVAQSSNAAQSATPTQQNKDTESFVDPDRELKEALRAVRQGQSPGMNKGATQSATQKSITHTPPAKRGSSSVLNSQKETLRQQEVHDTRGARQYVGERGDTFKRHGYSPFAPVLIMMLGVNLFFLFNIKIQQESEAQLNVKYEAQQRAVQESKDVRNQLQSIARKTKNLAINGNKNAAVVVAEMKQAGFVLNSE